MHSIPVKHFCSCSWTKRWNVPSKSQWSVSLAKKTSQILNTPNKPTTFALNWTTMCFHCLSTYEKGYSLVLGTSQCKQCNNSHLALLVSFAVMGVVLVFLLLLCKLTVATGTLSGLVFYANIVWPNCTIFLPVESTNAFSVFIPWLNLDFGIETFFFMMEWMPTVKNLQFVYFQDIVRC